MIAVSPFEMEIICDIAKKHVPDCDILAFGSRYKWTNEETSDLDLAVKGKGKIGFAVVGSMKEDFMESDLPFRVDVVDYHTISDSFKKIIDKGSEVIYRGKQGQSGMKAGEWRETKWGEIATLEYGKSLRDYQEKTSGFRVYGTNGPIGWHNEYLCGQPGVIIGRKGAYRGVHYSPTPFFVIDTAFYLNPKTEIDIRWAYYALLLCDINNMDSGSAIPSTSRADFYNLPVILPPLSVQKHIAKILGVLDDKIANNAAINRHLEQIAQAIYKSWFVDFEPWGGVMPDDWREGTLSELVTVKYGREHRKLADGSIPVFGSGGIVRFVDTALYRDESVLIPRKGTLNNVFYVNQPFWSVDTMFYTEMSCPNLAKFVYFFVRSKDLASMNAGSAVPSMTTVILNALPVVIPPADELARFEKVVSMPFAKIQENLRENDTLVAIRDTLLPRLMSGEFDLDTTRKILQTE